MDLRMACLHRARQELVAVADVLADADSEVVSKAHEVTGALKGLDRCADVESLQAGVEPPAPEDAAAVDATMALIVRAEAERKAGRFTPARTSLEEASKALDGVDYPPTRIRFGFALGATLEAQGKYPEARESMEQALDLAIENRDLERVQRIASELLHLVGYRMGQPQEAMQRYRRLAEGFANDDDARADAGNSVASVLKVQGKYAEAAAKEREVLALRIELDGPEHAYTGTAHTNLAITLNDLGEFEEAEKEVLQGLAIEEATLGAEHPKLGNTHNSLAIALNGQGKFAEAEAQHRRALEIRVAALGAEHPDVVESRNNLAVILARQGRLDEAEDEFRRVVALWDEVLGPDHPHASAAHHNLAIVLEMRDSFEEAESEYRHALDLRRSKLDEDHPDVANTRSALAALLIRRGDFDEAFEHAELAWGRLQRDDVSAPVRGDAAFNYARALWGAQDRPARRQKARELAAVAFREYERAGVGAASHAAELEAWADERGIRLGR
jgi:tetratricopeptide (TPR) repeat protein